MTGTLFLVGTPIGNLEDLTARARRTLGSVEVVAAEDTRRTGRLLQSLGVRARLLSFFEGNEGARVPEIMSLLEVGTDVALVTDAGMPGVSDPGYRLVAACVERGLPVDVVPGPSAVLAALVLSGLPTDRFAFEGFLPRSGRARRERLAAIGAEPRTVVPRGGREDGPAIDEAARMAGQLVAEGSKKRAAAREVAKRTGVAARDIYQRLATN